MAAVVVFGFCACGGTRLRIGGDAAAGGDAGPDQAVGTGGVNGSGGVTGSGAVSSGGVDSGGVTSGDGAVGGCGELHLSVERIQPDVLIVLQRSAGMDHGTESETDCDPADSACVSRWETAKAAIADVLSATAHVRWGLELYPGPGGADACSLSPAPQVPIASDDENAIRAKFATATVAGMAPLATAINAATSYLATVADGSPKYILLVTDGQADCKGGQLGLGNDLPNALVAVAAARAAGFPVYVLGVGPDVVALDQLASAGGTTSHFPATRPQDIEQALAPITSTAASCALLLPQAPVDLTSVVVYVDKERVDPDANDGWNFGASTAVIMLTGIYCEKVLSAASVTVDVLYDCARPTKGFLP
jgi:hypothetical protein